MKKKLLSLFVDRKVKDILKSPYIHYSTKNGDGVIDIHKLVFQLKDWAKDNGFVLMEFCLKVLLTLRIELCCY